MNKKAFLILAILALLPFAALAAANTPLNAQLDFGALMAAPQFSNSIQLIFSLALISLAPFFLISVTSFLRIVIVLSLIKTAVGTQQVPPATVIVGLAIFMTVFVMTPVWDEVNSTAVIPYNQGKLTQMKAIETGLKPLQKFMLKQTREKDLSLFIQFSHITKPKTVDEVPFYVLVPAYMISELKTAFQIGFILFIPFLIVDLTVSNILLSLGMFMLSPVMVSLPFKILLFVLVDGWNLITRGLLMSFR
ncbi:flagellar biosynthetic protein FliP [candidate division WOR-1 bacterium RIFOXYB2_FULL_42_35]|uniref:Flagellar biosynthetic protein FliP n=1 Tax=candidate division WOR-1 bacterium RIFOXYC2_FULL_41_25 TaxID=1802586 RepID=A0A1F4TKI4_UNCSA|nr:MAG: flagellar biosynthetic protein FliP [candidate division WOR-1 bacterium RIFOXYA2_FULL_41_14]OGC21565.1 MAG: flagellar biosynthetic protein FliP [candidate division WOR-1 bacterium RIFOXYB2_FULL_42_35]OGC32543.1 MAG: flagellar biosynthetic protein FliP [candidate division WOR-1 bacterium RIFOXYC2_FULL_41_25]